MNPELENIRLLQPEKVAEVLGVAVQTLANWRSSSDPTRGIWKGPMFINISQGNGYRPVIRYEQRAVVRWIESRKKKSEIRNQRSGIRKKRLVTGLLTA